MLSESLVFDSTVAIPGHKITRILEVTRFFYRLLIHDYNGDVFHCVYFNLDAIKKTGRLPELLHDIDILKEIRHPNVVPFVDFQRDDNRMYLLSPSYNSFTLEELITGNLIGEYQMHTIVDGLIQGLSVLHQCGINHGDIRPANIVIYDRCHPKIANFGFLSKFYPKSEKHLNPTHLNYLAPEILQNKYKDPFMADVWALGVTIFSIFTKQLPFCQANEIKLYNSIISCDYDCSLISDDLIQKIVCSCLISNPHSRATIMLVSDLYNSTMGSSRVGSSRMVRSSQSQLLGGYDKLQPIEDLSKIGKVSFRRNTHSETPNYYKAKPNIIKPVKTVLGLSKLF